MKYVLIYCEDRAPGEGRGLAGLLEAAKLSHLQELAQAGSAGMVAGHPQRKGQRVANGLHTHWTWLGYGGQEASRCDAGRCYALSADAELGSEEMAWCCDLVTQHDGRIVDVTAGGISTKEASTLVDALNRHMGSSARRWVVGEGSRHLLIASNHNGIKGSAATTIQPPEYLIGQPWREHVPRGTTGTWLHPLLEDAAVILERHETNRVRLDLGENPANLVWVWGTSTDGVIVPFQERSRMSGAMISTSFPFRGLAQMLGLTWVDGVTQLTESGCQRLSRTTVKLLAKHDFVYLPLCVDRVEPVERQCAMERIDQHLLKPLTEHLAQLGEFRCLVAVDDRPSSTIPFVALGTGLPSHPAVRLTSEAVANTPLTFPDGTAAFTWLTGNPVVR